MAKQRQIIQIQEKVPLSKGIPLSIQHTFAMFSASVLVPYIFGISPSIALLMNGIGTLIFIFVTKGKAPAYLGSSFAFISPALIVMSNPDLGFRYALGGFVVTGLLMCLVALIIKFVGTAWIDAILPPAAMGPVVALIGLELAGSAAQTAGILGDDGSMVADLDPKVLIVFLVTLLLAIFGGVLYRGFASAIAILIGAAYLLWRRVISWHIPVAFIGTAFIFSGILWLVDPSAFADPVTTILTGGIMLGACFMATDMVTSPMAHSGQLVFGVGCGLLTIIIRNWGAYPEGVSFAILLMNSVTPLINRWCKPTRFAC